MLSLSDALAMVKRNCAPLVDPVLSDAELTAILTDQSTTTTWTANTAYSYGSFVVPTVPQGRLYRCTLAGTSDPTTEPVWLLAPAWTRPPSFFAGWLWGVSVSPFLNSPWIYGLASGTAAFCDFGPFSGELYDTRAATRSAWLLKAQKASNQPALKRLGPMEERPMTYEQCMSQARLYAPLGFM